MSWRLCVLAWQRSMLQQQGAVLRLPIQAPCLSVKQLMQPKMVSPSAKQAVLTS